MTKLLKQAFDEVSKLPDGEQDAVAKWLLAEVQSDRRWTEMFEHSQDVLSEMAQEALDEHEKGKTKRLSSELL